MDDFNKLLPTLMPELTSKERMFVRAFKGDVIDALRLAGFQGSETYLLDIGKNFLSRYEICTAIKLNIAKAEKKESAVLSKIERMELLSSIARNVDPYAIPTKDDFGMDKYPDPPTISERIKAVDLLNKIEGDYQNNMTVKHEYSLSEMVQQSYEDDLVPIDTIEAEYLLMRDYATTVPAPSESQQNEKEGLFI